MRYLLLVTLLWGCSFDFNARDGGIPEDGPVDAWVDAGFLDGEILVDAYVIEAGPDANQEDASPDSGTDSGSDEDSGMDAGDDVLTCTDVPDISGRYRVTRRLMGCVPHDSGLVTLTRIDSCNYEFDDASANVFDGPCELVVEGSTYRYECRITYNVWLYHCTLTRVSGGLRASCRFTSGAAPPTTDPCPVVPGDVFFLPEE